MTAGVASIVDNYQGVAPQRIVRAVAEASVRTGANFGSLMEKAAAESGFNPKATAKTSSATGLFQFIESTWLSMVKQYGGQFGLEKYADKITLNDKGEACVTDCAAKKEILALRKNPEISALMAGEFSAENKQFLEANTKGPVGKTELYLAHFLGAGGAAKFLNARAENAHTSAAKLLPAAARANKTVFYNKTTGKPRSLDQVYAFFAKKFSSTTETASSANSPSVAQDTPAVPSADDVSVAASVTANTHALIAAQTLPSSDLARILWDMPQDSGTTGTGMHLSANMLMALIEMQKPPTQTWSYNT